jgi:vancomycin resistance protein YoaR
LLVQWTVLVLTLITVVAAVLGFAYAGSSKRLAEGVRIAGLDVGGMTSGAAKRRLERRAAAVANVPVVFAAGDRRWTVTPAQLGVRTDWNAAVEAAQRQGGGFGPIRGFRRIGVRVFGADVAPPTTVYEAALNYELNAMARALGRPHREPSLRLNGLQPVVVAGRSGRRLDRDVAAHVVVDALASFQRGIPVALPVRLERPHVTNGQIEGAAAKVRAALSAPVRMRMGYASWWLPQSELARMLLLPRGGRSAVQIGAPGADRYFAGLSKAINRAPRDAGFAIASDGSVSVTPARAGRILDVPETAKRILRAALRRDRVATVVLVRTQPGRSTAEARALKIKGLVGGYETIYGGDPNRIHNVQLVARLLDGHLIAPGATFSFNTTTGARTAEKGFREAPVIINGELQTGLGGGVCQVSTTVFNAAYEAGLKITSRTNHALYISHYPTGRDATVNYPDTDLRFVNDTGHWLLLRTLVGSSSLVVNLYGMPVHRRVVTKTAPLVERGEPRAQYVSEPDWTKGQTVIEDSGEPARSTSVERRVYSAAGRLVYDDKWYSYYRSEPKIVHVGTKPKPKPKPKPPPPQPKKKKKPPPPPPPTTTTAPPPPPTTPQP